MKPKVFGIGLPRTGSTSLAEAMRLLGYNSLHTPIGLHHFLEYDFTADPLTVMKYKFLDHIFPDAKFILTLRDIKSWLLSNKLYCEEVVDKLFEGQVPIDVGEQRFALFGTTSFDMDKFIIAFHSHISDVLNHFKERKDKLLVFNVCGGQSWETLCPFLGIDIPDIQFPSLNKMMKINDTYITGSTIFPDNIPLSDKGVIINALNNIDNGKFQVSSEMEKTLRDRLAEIDKDLKDVEVRFC